MSLLLKFGISHFFMMGLNTETDGMFNQDDVYFSESFETADERSENNWRVAKERLSEMGLRKAYGATNQSLIGQVLTENLLLTFIGGLSGLALAYLITLMGGEVILNLMDEDVTLFNSLSTQINLEMLINLPLFLTVFGICLLLNLISALVPTLLALRHPIIYSIQTKR